MSNRVTVYSKIDIRSLATIAKFLFREGRPPKSQSDLANTAIEVFADYLVSNDIAKETPTKEEAIEDLKDLGITWSRGSRGRKDVLSALDKKGSSPKVSQETKESTSMRDLEETAKELRNEIAPQVPQDTKDTEKSIE